ncbi:MAG: hypothetical protein V3R83_09595 [Gammaproteobacteria bacterium]
MEKKYIDRKNKAPQWIMTFKCSKCGRMATGWIVTMCDECLL